MKKLLLLSLLAIAISTQAQNVGIGNPAPAEKLDVRGNINLTGTIKANGVDGTARQVLAKNESNNLAWVNTAHTNNTRFKLRFQENTTDNDNFAPITGTMYNLNTTNIAINNATGTVTFNKTGLYHFDLTLNTRVATASNPTDNPIYFIALIGSGLDEYLEVGNFTPINSTKSIWSLIGAKSFDLHITAPFAMRLYYLYGNGTKSNLRCELNGHLISE
jgi:hypothetical protein